MWIPLSFAPSTYEGFHQCHGLCEQTLDPTTPTNLSISSPYTFTGIDPSTFCIVGLNGVYGNDTIVLGTENTTTLSSGKLCYILIFTIVMLYNIYSTHVISQ